MSRLSIRPSTSFVAQRLIFKTFTSWFIDDFHDPVELEIEEVIEAEISQSLANPFTGGAYV